MDSPLDDTAAQISHQVNNIVQALNGGAFLIDQGLKKENSEVTSQGWGIVKRNQAKLSQLLLDLISLGKPYEPQPAICRPIEIAKGVFDGLAELPASGPTALKLEHPMGILDVVMDYRHSNTEFEVISAGLMRTARKLASGEVFIPKAVWARD